MSQAFFKSKNNLRTSNKTGGKCGEITFCMQVGKRVYALKCLFCPQICIQWDAFINHIEDEHDEDLRSGHLLQREIEEVNVVSKQSNVSLTKESPLSRRIRVRTEYNDNSFADPFSDSNHPLIGSEARTLSRARTYECRVVNAARYDQTCDIDEQITFDSINSLSETDSDLEFTNAHSSATFQPDKLTYMTANMSYIGDVDLLQPLPSTQEISQLRELQALLRINVLENKHRTRLAKEVIGHILNKQPDRKILKDDFMKLAQSIVEIFPFEVKETYYVPYRTGNTAKGKLFDAYNNTRSRLSAAGVINRRLKAKPEENIVLKNGNDFGNENTADIDESELSILNSACTNWDLVLATWRKTHSFRQRELKNPNLKTHEYIDKYKVLLHANNYDLFDMDFKMLYPKSKNIYEWKLYYRKIIAKAEKLRDRADIKEILTNIDETQEEDSKLALSLMLIAYVLPNPRKKTKLEIQEHFISYCKDITEVDEETSLCTKRIKLEDEPKVYLVADSSKKICQAFVDVCGSRLMFENPIKAIEVCFYCFMTMNIKYPKYIAHVWIFIQHLIYEVNTKRDTVIPAINTLINDLRLDKLQQ